MRIKTYKNGITVEGYSNGWIEVSRMNDFYEYETMRYLYYTRREAYRKFKEHFNIK